jgi:hypothetical protein
MLESVSSLLTSSWQSQAVMVAVADERQVAGRRIIHHSQAVLALVEDDERQAGGRQIVIHRRARKTCWGIHLT